jgi:hypothetical protein
MGSTNERRIEARALTKKIVGLFTDQRDTDLSRWQAGSHHPLAIYRRTLWYKARPRSEDYLRSMFDQRYPSAAFIRVDGETGWHSSIADADVVVLVYADCIGLGCARLERQVGHHSRDWASVRVLNGRGRDFLLSRGELMSLRLRRVIARTMIVEWVLIALFLLATPLLMVWNVIGGKRDGQG